MKFSEYLDKCSKMDESYNLRIGQWYMRNLPLTIVERVVDTDIDPFYDSTRIPAFLAAVGSFEEWDAE